VAAPHERQVHPGSTPLSYVKHKQYRQRYVSWSELQAQRAATAAIQQMAHDSLKSEQATSAVSLTPLLRYHDCSTRSGCELGLADDQARHERVQICVQARGAVLCAPWPGWHASAQGRGSGSTWGPSPRTPIGGTP